MIRLKRPTLKNNPVPNVLQLCPPRYECMWCIEKIPPYGHYQDLAPIPKTLWTPQGFNPILNQPILNNHVFPPRLWAANGLTSMNDLYKNRIFSSFSALSAKCKLPRCHLFCFFQIRHFIQKQFPYFPNPPPKQKSTSSSHPR